jgi:hypothetical protein
MSTNVTPGAPAPSATPPANSAPDTKAAAPEAADGAEADASDEGSDEAEAPKAEVKQEKAIAALKKKYQLKIDGKEEEVEIDLSNDEEVRKHLQMSKAAYKRMQQFAEYEKGVKGLIDTLKSDPLKVLADPRLGIPDDVRRKLAETIINGEIEESLKTPEQKEKERLQKEYENLKKQVEDEKKQREDAEMTRMQEQVARNLDSEMTAAITEAGLPKTARTVKYLAEAMQLSIENNLNLSAKDLIPYVKKQAVTEFRELVQGLSDTEFEEFMDKDISGRVRKRNLAKLKQTPPSAEQIKATGEEIKKDDQPTKKIPLRDFMKELGGKF